MNREILTPTSEAEWLGWRRGDITSTEVSALFGASPYTTEFELYHVKRGTLAPEFEMNDRIKWGTRLESAIAHGIAEDLGLVVEPFKTYMRVPELRMGSSFDFKVIGLDDNYRGDENTYRDLFRELGPGVLEVKNVDGLQFKRAWNTGDEAEAPPHIELQVQHQLEVADLPWGLIAPLVGGNTPRPFYRLRAHAMGEAIREAVAAFWARVDSGTPPEIDYLQDADAVIRLNRMAGDEVADMSMDNHLADLTARYLDVARAEKEAEAQKKALKAEILDRIGTCSKVYTGVGSISAGMVKDSPGTLVLPEHVGTYLGGRKGYRNFRVYPK